MGAANSSDRPQPRPQPRPRPRPRPISSHVKSDPDESYDNPRFARDSKKVAVNGVRRKALIIPDGSKRFAFENDLKGGAPMCWRLATLTADQFVASGLRDAKALFTKSTEIHIHFPAFTRYFVVKSFQSVNGFTLARIIRCIESTAIIAMAYYIENDMQNNHDARKTIKFIKRLLRLYAMCAINIKGNNVYCITADV